MARNPNDHNGLLVAGDGHQFLPFHEALRASSKTPIEATAEDKAVTNGDSSVSEKPADENAEHDEVDENALEGVVDELEEIQDQIKSNRPAFWDWEDDRIRNKIRYLVDGNLNNYGRIYERMEVRHGIKKGEDFTRHGGSFIKGMNSYQLRIALYAADNLLI